MKALKNENNLIDLLTLWKSSKHCTLSLSFAGKMHLTLKGAHMRIITFYPVWYSCISFLKLNVCPRRPDPNSNSNVWGYWWNALDAALWKLWKSMTPAWNASEKQNDNHDFFVPWMQSFCICFLWEVHSIHRGPYQALNGIWLLMSL